MFDIIMQAFLKPFVEFVTTRIGNLILRRWRGHSRASRAPKGDELVLANFSPEATGKPIDMATKRHIAPSTRQRLIAKSVPHKAFRDFTLADLARHAVRGEQPNDVLADLARVAIGPAPFGPSWT